MAYLFFQTWVWLLLAFLLGLLLGGFFCWLCCRNIKHEYTQQVKTEPVKKQAPAQVSTPAAPATPPPAPKAVKKIAFMTEPPADVDDLKRIKGVGAVLEGTLNKLGIYQFKQVAAFSQDEVDWVNEAMSFPGRIEREDWINQARKLSAGMETEFSKRVDGGEVEY